MLNKIYSFTRVDHKPHIYKMDDKWRLVQDKLYDFLEEPYRTRCIYARLFIMKLNY